MLNRPGFKTSEWMITVLNFAGQVALQLNGNETTGTATKYTLVGAVAYIVSRGLAKYEPRATPPQVITTRTVQAPQPPVA